MNYWFGWLYIGKPQKLASSTFDDRIAGQSMPRNDSFIVCSQKASRILIRASLSNKSVLV